MGKQNGFDRYLAQVMLSLEPPRLACCELRDRQREIEDRESLAVARAKLCDVGRRNTLDVLVRSGRRRTCRAQLRPP